MVECNTPFGVGGDTMARLTSQRLQELQECIREIYSYLDRASLQGHIIQTVSRVIPSGVVSCAKITHQKQKIGYVGQTSCRSWEGLDAFVRHMHEHPILNYLHAGHLKPHRFREEIATAVQKRFPSLRQNQHYAAAKISDALTDRRFRSLGLYHDFFRKNGVDYQMLVSFLPAGLEYSLISFNRDKKDFTEEERLILNLLAPHIAQAMCNAEAHAKARLAFGMVEGSGQSRRTSGLTYREEDVLYWVAQGKTNAETARILDIAPATVKVHLEKIYDKLGVGNRTAAAAFATGMAGRKKPRD